MIPYCDQVTPGIGLWVTIPILVLWIPFCLLIILPVSFVCMLVDGIRKRREVR